MNEVVDGREEATAVLRLVDEDRTTLDCPMPPPAMRPDRIRVLAVAVCRDGDRLLVERGRDAVTGERFYRAIGGGVEPGERAAEAVAREWREEYGLALASLEPLGVLESLFTYEGRPGHEVVFAFAARLADETVRARASVVSVDGEGLVHEAEWVPIAALAAGPPPLYPDGLLALLARHAGGGDLAPRARPG